MSEAFPAPAAAPAPPAGPDPQRVLIIKPSSLGDVVHALPVLNLMRRRWPAAHIAWLVSPVCVGIVQGLPQLDEVILFERKRFASAWRSVGVLGDVVRFARDLRQRDFDLVVDLQGLFRSGLMAWQTGASRRIGFANAREGAWAFYTQTVEVPDDQVHAVDRYLKVASALGCGDAPVDFTFPVRDEDREHVQFLVNDAGPYAVLMPGTNWLTKRWPAEYFETLVAPLRERFGLTGVLAGGTDAMELSARIPSALNLAGRTNLPQLVALLEGASLVIANDSGPMHIAAALGRPLVTMFGPTNPVRTGPYGRPDSVVRVEIPCSPCYSRKCSHVSCMRWLMVEDVLSAAERQLAGQRVVA